MNAPAIATPIAHPDADILAAWDRRQVAYALFNDLPYAPDGMSLSPDGEAELAIVNETERFILASTATTARGVEIQLWIPFGNGLTDREDDAAAAREDVDWFTERNADLEWDRRFMLAAIRSLRAMQGGAA